MTILAVVDTETTGLADNDEVCELGVAVLHASETRVEKTRLLGVWRTFIKPSCSMSVVARATHHITDEELADAPSMTELLLKRGIPEFGHSTMVKFDTTMYGEVIEPADVVFIAHNAEFDRKLLKQSGMHESILPPRTICTYKCSRHLWPDAERHSNQVLRYVHNLQPLFKLDGPPHRVLPDVAITAAILVKMLETHTINQLVELTNQPVLLSKCGFGKNRGVLWMNLDAGFLSWVLARDFGADEKYTAQYWLDVKQGRRQHNAV